MEIVNGMIQASNVFHRLNESASMFVDKEGKLHTDNPGNFKSRYNVFVLEGGSRSTKTTSIIQFWFLYAQLHRGKPKRVVISRKKSTWIKTTVLFDFLKALKDYGWYQDRNYNKTDRIYKLFDTEFWFIGLDDEQKLHGMTTDAFWINEAIEASQNDFDQLEMRCGGFAILDYNPTEEEHWIYDSVCKRDDACWMHSTQLDNPFLPENMRRKLLSYEPTEENYRNGTANKNKWEIYGLGKRAKIEGLVFTSFEIVQEIPSQVVKRFTGLDFGYTNDVTAMGDVGFWENGLYIDELCYRTHMLTGEIIKTLKEVNKGRKVISESADPRLVDEIYNAGINIHAVEKGAGSVKAGLDKMKDFKIHVTERSINAIREFKNYTYKQDKNGKWLNEPIDDWNHIIDLVRYVVLMEILGKAKPNNLKKVAKMFH